MIEMKALLRVCHGMLLIAATFEAVGVATAKTPEGMPLIVLIAGKPSHEPGEHEHNAGVRLFAKALAQGAPQVRVRVYLDENWPSLAELAHADTVLLYGDSGGALLAKGDRTQQLEKQMARGAGFIALHYAVALDEAAPQALNWLGGSKEVNWSVNPVWKAHFRKLPAHPVTRGVKPFSTEDEWYYHMRFAVGRGAITPVLFDLPPLESVNAGCCGYEGNPTVLAEVKAGKPQTTAWAFERPDGGRGFGFTGGHYHRNWANDDQRKLLLNAILWTAHVDVPAAGVESDLTAEDMTAYLDVKPSAK